MEISVITRHMAPMARSSPKTATIIGTGVVGMATAYELARRGLSVILVDRWDEPGQGTSFANGAQLSYQYTDALASPYLRKSLIPLALGRVPEFRLHLNADPDYARWFLSFLRNCTSSRWHQNTAAALELGLQSKAAMAALLETHSLDFLHRTSGKLHIYHDADTFAAALEAMDIKREHGATQRTVDQEEAAAIEPAIALAEGSLVGFIHTTGEEVGDPLLFCREMLRVLKTEYDATFVQETEIQALTEHDGGASLRGKNLSDGSDVELTSDLVIVCAGHKTPTLLRSFGYLPIEPMKGYSLTLPATYASPVVSITDTSNRFVITRLGDKVRMAGLAEIGAHHVDIDPAQTDLIRATVRSVLPAAAEFEEPGTAWAGLRPMTPDQLPRIGMATPHIGYNAGHGQLGWTFAMGSAERLATAALG
ncbi:MAG: FAD-dependent oxidoreductase [Parvularcula sp.]